MIPEPTFVRECPSCGRTYTGTRAEMFRLRACECGNDFPSAPRLLSGNPPTQEDAGTSTTAGVEAGTPTHLRRCASCGTIYRGTEAEMKDLWYCESCKDELMPLERIDSAGDPIAKPKGGDVTAGRQGAQPQEEPAARNSTLVLRLAGTDVIEVLPLCGGECVYGRLTAGHPTLASMRTLSRRQFAYRLKGELVEIQNLGQFSMTVGGRTISQLQSTQVRLPTTIEMAGSPFELSKADD